MPTILGQQFTGVARFLESYICDRRLQHHEYQIRQNRRWLTAKIHTEGDDDIPDYVRWPLMQHWKKDLSISDDLALTDDVKSALALLRDERAVAAAQQGNPDRVADWWVQPEIRGKRKKGMKGKKGKNAKKLGATAGQGVNVERFGDDVGALGLGEDEEMKEEMEEEEGGVRLEEGFEGFESPAMMSPVGSVVGDREEEEDAEEEG